MILCRTSGLAGDNGYRDCLGFGVLPALADSGQHRNAGTQAVRIEYQRSEESGLHAVTLLWIGYLRQQSESIRSRSRSQLSARNVALANAIPARTNETFIHGGATGRGRNFPEPMAEAVTNRSQIVGRAPGAGESN